MWFSTKKKQCQEETDKQRKTLDRWLDYERKALEIEQADYKLKLEMQKNKEAAFQSICERLHLLLPNPNKIDLETFKEQLSLVWLFYEKNLK